MVNNNNIYEINYEEKFMGIEKPMTTKVFIKANSSKLAQQIFIEKVKENNFMYDESKIKFLSVKKSQNINPTLIN